MKSIWYAPVREEILNRLDNLQPESAARWGRFTAPQMVSHLTEAARMAFGDLQVKPRNLPLRWFPLKQLVIYVLPFPKGAPTAKELVSRTPGHWHDDLDALRTLVRRFETEPVERAWPEHPAFGPLDAKQWGILVYRHSDHHLRQFGV